MQEGLLKEAGVEDEEKTDEVEGEAMKLAAVEAAVAVPTAATLASAVVTSTKPARSGPPKQRQPSYYEVVEEVLSMARDFRKANYETPCNFFFINLHSVAKVGITSREVYDLLFADNLRQSTFVLAFSDRDDRRKRSSADADARRRKPKLAVYPCCGCGKTLSPQPASSSAGDAPKNDQTTKLFDNGSGGGASQVNRFELSLHNFDTKEQKKKKKKEKKATPAESEEEQKAKTTVDADEKDDKKKKAMKMREKKVSVKRLMSSALAYFLARFSLYLPVGSAPAVDALWMIGKRGSSMCDLAEQIQEFVAIQNELADVQPMYRLVVPHVLGLADDRHDDPEHDEAWASLRAEGVISHAQSDVENARHSESADLEQGDDTTLHDQFGVATTAPLSPDMATVLNRIEKWIMKNARNDFHKRKDALADVGDYRGIVMLPRERTKLRNFIAPLCRITRKIDTDEVASLLQADGVLSVCGCCLQFKWNERALTSEDSRLERKRRLERERARGIAQGRERMLGRILASLEAKGSRPTSIAELRKVVENFGDYEEQFDGDQILQHLVNANVIAIDVEDVGGGGGSFTKQRETVRYVVAQRRIEGMKHQERLERARRRGDQGAWEAELERERQRREADRRERTEAQQANREREEAERMRQREVFESEREAAEHREVLERQRQADREERKQRYMANKPSAEHDLGVSPWQVAHGAHEPSSPPPTAVASAPLRQSTDSLADVGGLFNTDADDDDGDTDANAVVGGGDDDGHGGSWPAAAPAYYTHRETQEAQVEDYDPSHLFDDGEDLPHHFELELHDVPASLTSTMADGEQQEEEEADMTEDEIAALFGGGTGVPRGIDQFGGWEQRSSSPPTIADSDHRRRAAEAEDEDDRSVAVEEEEGGDNDDGELGLDMFGWDNENDAPPAWAARSTGEHEAVDAGEEGEEGDGDEEEDVSQPGIAGMHYLGAHSFLSTEWNPGF